MLGKPPQADGLLEAPKVRTRVKLGVIVGRAAVWQDAKLAQPKWLSDSRTGLGILPWSAILRL
jgi:hypothetical protein